MIRTLLIANRGEIALRVMRSARDLGIATLAVAPQDDAASLHMLRAEQHAILPGRGVAAYLDIDAILATARAAGCDAIHPGYGFLSENADFAAACGEAGIAFVGPTPEQLSKLGDKASARALAQACGVPVLAGTQAGASVDAIAALMADLGMPVMLKAVAGGGGRGIRLVRDITDLPEAYDRCASEAERAFGDARVYAEQALVPARHVEVQLLGDGRGNVRHFGERDCSLQRRHQKLLEITPSPALTERTREALYDAAMNMARAVDYRSLGTFEFLVEADSPDPAFYFLEANPRIQVEHTITEELWDVDLVRLQLEIAGGAVLGDLALDRASPRTGYVIQARVNMERLQPDGNPVMDAGTISAYEPPTGPGIRVDGFGYRGYRTSAGFDSLLAKLIVRSRGDYPAALARTERALGEFTVAGVATNIALLRALLTDPDVQADRVSTRLLDSKLPDLLARAEALEPAPVPAASEAVVAATGVDEPLPDGVAPVCAPLTGVVVSMLVAPGATVRIGEPVAIVESMKMEHVALADRGGEVIALLTGPGDSVSHGQRLLTIRVDDALTAIGPADEAIDLDDVRADVAEAIARHDAVLDAGRPDAVARRRSKGQRTARENVEALCDPDSFVEYGSLVVAGQRARRSMEELLRKTPGDGVVVGFGDVNGTLFPKAASQSLVIAFDETVLAGTMGELAREKLKHCLEVARQASRPVVLFAEGGGGRAGDTDLRVAVTGWTMDVSSYFQLSRLSGTAPLVGVTSGRCFAANAGMLSCCDVIIATRESNIGVGGPSMIEGGRLGSFTPEEIGPSAVQTTSGVIDILVADEAEAVAVARRYLSYFQGPVDTFEMADQRRLRFVVPENRLRAYDIRAAIDLLADTGSVLELRRDFGVGIVTALARVGGRPIGIVANNPNHLGGAVDADGADKACRFMKLCEAFGLPLLMLCDTPGMMVGPEAETTATVRKMGRMFVTGANLTVPFFTIVLRKAYGIGGILMAGGWFKAPRFVVSWPTGEFGGMNIEGNVKLAHAAELQAITDPAERQARFETLVAEMLQTGRALAVATHNEVDHVIDPADTRRWIEMAIATHTQRKFSDGKAMPFVDPW
ncbi:carboxyl transferase domain-containing protein [Sphingomonas sp.]|uniref:carboxyl transferase domain-containing protein n=1 Tax=Sphingomonas sp. TaxID=28214 RepID=UPI001EB2726D|nr:carboxyl transferase domain-containing protein [Sphingomonas sp.]MBX3595033.1 hypothetical protein [Sphingomonas sp.]